MCVGALDSGASGNCAFIRVNVDEDGNAGLSHNGSLENEIDALLPLDLDPESRRLATISGQEGTRSFPRSQSPAEHGPSRLLEANLGHRGKPVVHNVQCGKDIVNSVKIHRLRSSQKDCKDEDVVVVTNNDKTVRVFSLSQMCNLTTLEFDCAMNHASISPSGKLMIAVGDEPRVFFCKRSQLSSITTYNEGSYANYDWEQIAEPEISLAHQRHFLGDLAVELPERIDTCFATAFSPSGHLCAAASQTGIITVFNTSLISPDMDSLEAVVDIFKTSRPVAITNFSGAVRSMSFSPAPWDLLAWAEDRGRVCVVDVRSGLSRSKQILNLDVDSPDLNSVHVTMTADDDLTSEERQLEIEARFIMRQREALEAQDRLATVSNASDFMEIAAQRRRLIQEARIDSPRPSDENFHAFSEAEERMLEEIRQYRLHETSQMQNQSSEPPPDPYSINYPEFSQRNRQASSRAQDRELGWHFRSSPSAESSLNSISRSTDSIRDWINTRSALNQIRGSNRREPRRRSSVVISNSNDSSRTISSHPSSLAPIGTTVSNFSASPSRLATYTPPSPPLEPTVSETRRDAWDIISNAMTTTNPQSSEPSSRNHPQEPTSLSTNDALIQYSPTNSRYRNSPFSNANNTISPSTVDPTTTDAVSSAAALDRSYASLRVTMHGNNADEPIAQSAAADRSLAALHAQQDRSLQQLRDQQAQLATYQARYERLRSVNAADMRRLEQNYLERSASGRGGVAAVDPTDEELALVRRMAAAAAAAGGGGGGSSGSGGGGGGGLGRSTAVAAGSATVTGTMPSLNPNGRLMRRIIVHDLRGEENDGPITMGLGWSIDGSRLFVGTEEGILGYDVDLKGRMQFPAGEWL